MEAKNRRAWIKNVAIIFLTVLLLLTFFSNTILNYSLPEVSAQYAKYDSISGAIKATGTVKANESYVVTYDEADSDSETTTPGQTRKVISVYVKQGSEVAIGDPILALEGGASDEQEKAQEDLKTLEKELRELEKNYALEQLTDTINDLTSDKSKSESLTTLAKSKTELAELQELYAALLAGTDPTETLKAQQKEAQKEADSIQKQIDAISEKITEVKGKISAAEGNIKEDYTTTKTLQERYNEAKQAYESLKAEYDTLTAQVDTLQQKYDQVCDTFSDSKEVRTLTQNIEKLESQIEGYILSLERTIENYFTGNNSSMSGTIVGGETGDNVEEDSEDLTDTSTEVAQQNVAAFNEMLSMGFADEYYNINNYLDISIYRGKVSMDMYIVYKGETRQITDTSSKDTSFRRNVEDTLAQIEEATESIEINKAKLAVLGNYSLGEVDSYIVEKAKSSAEEELKASQKELENLTTDYEAAKTEYESLAKEVNSSSVITENEALLEVFEADLETYKEKLEEANEKVTDLKEQIEDNKNTKTAEQVKEEIDTLTTSIQTLELQMKIDDATEKKTDAESSYDKEDQAIAIEEKKAEIESLQAKIKAMEEAPDETIVTAPIAGKIVEVNFVPGNKVTSGNTVATIEVADKGYICELTMTTEEARKIQVGAECSITNSWWYSDIEASVTQIRSDPSSQGKNRIVVIEVKGDVYEGQSLTFSIGDKSQSYDSVLPNSAIREDSEGKFVLVVESKNTPLSVRYTARRMSIEVITSDDTKSAVSGLYGSEFVITSATSPISDGQQVRLAEN